MITLGLRIGVLIVAANSVVLDEFPVFLDFEIVAPEETSSASTSIDQKFQPLLTLMPGVLVGFGPSADKLPVSSGHHSQVSFSLYLMKIMFSDYAEFLDKSGLNEGLHTVPDSLRFYRVGTYAADKFDEGVVGATFSTDGQRPDLMLVFVDGPGSILGDLDLGPNGSYTVDAAFQEDGFYWLRVHDDNILRATRNVGAVKFIVVQ